ncbi:MAG: type III-B CRISPR module RAMP protein Cmr1 [Firmicutes bacterium]|nr:type III-B CRISPR module RAMP protein Cmr1 [Bacillota bacterium]
MQERVYTLTALTDIWTGSISLREDKKGGSGQDSVQIVPDRLVTTGLLGSIRWWFEVLVRGLGGAPCGLDDEPDTRKEPDEPGHHCVVCELFGCTGWARKFRFDVLAEDGKAQQNQITKDNPFRIRFTPLRPVRDEEWALLDLTLRLIADYGAIGGKTSLKPSGAKNPKRYFRPRNFGFVRIKHRPSVPRLTEYRLRAYVTDPRWRYPKQEGFSWASLDHVWCVKARYHARQDRTKSTFNRVTEQPEKEWRSSHGDSRLARRETGSEGDRERKNVFSFKEPQAQRSFGFVRHPREFEATQQLLREVWKDLRTDDFLTGDAIIRKLFDEGGNE